MKVQSLIPILASASTAYAAACKPDPAATTGGWSSGGWSSGGGDGSDIPWTAVAPTGTVIPGEPDSYGTFTKPATMPTGNTPPDWQQGDPSGWDSTSGDAMNNPGLPNSPDHRGCWGGGFDINTPPNSWPDSGNVCKYEFTMMNVTLSPDGIPKQMLTVNGQYPGPLVECNWGDTIEVTVTNALQNNGTGIHWHGFRQEGSCEMDGVPGVTECPLAPGQTKIYRFKATSYGTTWYHSHFSIQAGDGIKGPVIIHGPASANYDIDLGTVQLDEAYPLTAFQEDHFAHLQGPPQASNVLYNGKNIQPDLSAGERQTFTFTPGKKHRIRLINTSIDSMFAVQIDNHNMSVIANDFVSIIPYTTDSLSIGIGQRYDVIVDADQAVSNYWFRAIPQQGAAKAAAPPAPASTAAPGSRRRQAGPPPGGPGGAPPQGCCSNVNTGLNTANAIIQYQGATATLPTTNYTTFDISCSDEPIASLVPVVTVSVDSSSFAAQESQLPVNLQGSIVDGTRVNFWYLNGISQDIDWAAPTLPQVVGGNDSFATIRDVVILEESNVWTFWVIQNQFCKSPDPIPTPPAHTNPPLQSSPTPCISTATTSPSWAPATAPSTPPA